VETGLKHISWVAVELPGLHQSGREISLELSFGEFYKDGRRFFTGIARDITRRKLDEKRLAGLQKITDSALAHLSQDDLLQSRSIASARFLRLIRLPSCCSELKAMSSLPGQRKGWRKKLNLAYASRLVRVSPQGCCARAADYHRRCKQRRCLQSPAEGKRHQVAARRSFVCRGRATGVLHVGKFELAHFTEDDVRLLQLAADRLALAIENARLYQDEKSARAAAENANRAKDEFLTILSHELRTPLTPIIGWVQMMQNGFLSDGESGKALSIINRNAYNLKRLINDLLDMFPRPPTARSASR